MQSLHIAGRNRYVCPACGYVHYHNPVPGVGVLIEHEGRLALIQRGHAPRAGEWALPSGFIEADERVEHAAVREAFEETGLEIELTELFGVYSFPEGPPMSGLIVFYRARPLDVSLLRAGDDAVAVAFYAPDELPPVPFRTHREVIAKWRALVAA
jgi:8-oxo-dGTP diphosphatase